MPFEVVERSGSDDGIDNDDGSAEFSSSQLLTGDIDDRRSSHFSKVFGESSRTPADTLLLAGLLDWDKPSQVKWSIKAEAEIGRAWIYRVELSLSPHTHIRRQPVEGCGFDFGQIT